MVLAEQDGLSELVAERVQLGTTRVSSAGVNPAGKLSSIIAGMAAGVDSIDDLEVIRSGGMTRLFEQVYAPATLGQFLREFTHGHCAQLASVARAHLVNLATRTDLLAGIEDPGVHRHRFAAAPGVRARQAGRQLRAHQDRRQAGPAQGPVAVGDHDQHPVSRRRCLAGIGLRAGKAGSGKGAASMVREAISTARAAGASGPILVRGDSAYGNSAVVGACVKAKVRFSVVLTKNRDGGRRDQRHPRGRVDTGGLPRRRARP